MFVRPKPKLGTLCINTFPWTIFQTQDVPERSCPVHIIAELQQGRFNRGGRYLKKFVALWFFTSVLEVLVDKALLKKLFYSKSSAFFLC